MENLKKFEDIIGDRQFFRDLIWQRAPKFHETEVIPHLDVRCQESISYLKTDWWEKVNLRKHVFRILGVKQKTKQVNKAPL